MSDKDDQLSPPPSDEAAHRACPSCGAVLDEVETFCHECGEHVETFFAPRAKAGPGGKSKEIAIIAAVALVLAGLCLLAFGLIVERMRDRLSESLEGPPSELVTETPSESELVEALEIPALPMVTETNVDVEPVVVEPEPKPVVAPALEAQRRYEAGLALEQQAVALTGDPAGALRMVQNALREYRAAASKGHFEALFRIAEVNAKGICMPANPERAINYYLEAAEGGVRKAQDAAAVMFVDGVIGLKECPNCMEWLQHGADRGSTGPVYALGKAYTQGELLPKNAAKALQYLRRAAQAGRADAMNDIGYLLLSEEDGLRDLPKAHSFFLRAASSGEPDGLNAFYSWLRDKVVEDLDLRQPMRGAGDMMVIRKYTGLVVRGEIKSVGSRSVTVIQKGTPTELDFTDIDVKARTALDPKFRVLVAGLRLHENLAALAKGKVDPLQPAEGRADIQRANGLALKNGSYGQRDYPAAFVWLRTAAHQDDVAAMYHLGEMYYRGHGVYRNQTLALGLMERAKSAGYGPAATFIQRHWAKQEKYAQMQKIAQDALLVERARHARDLEQIGSEPHYNDFFSTRTGAIAPTVP